MPIVIKGKGRRQKPQRKQMKRMKRGSSRAATRGLPAAELKEMQGPTTRPKIKKDTLKKFLNGPKPYLGGPIRNIPKKRKKNEKK